MSSVGVDIGGTKIAAGVVDDDGAVLQRLVRPTPAHDSDLLLAEVLSVVRELAGSFEVASVGVGVAGFVDAARTSVRFAPNLAWRGEPVRDLLSAALGLPVVIENDTNAGAWGEFRFGAGKHANDQLFVGVGTGVGGGLVLNGQLYRGRFGMAAEIGHLRFVPEGRPCQCGQLGCWEQYAAGPALTRAAQEAVAAGDGRADGLIALAGSADAVTGKTVTDAAQAGDPLGLELLGEAGRMLGEGIASLCAILDPELIVLGGGLSEVGQLLLDPTEEALRTHLTGAAYREVPQLRLAELGNDAGMIGAADLSRHP